MASSFKLWIFSVFVLGTSLGIYLGSLLAMDYVHENYLSVTKQEHQSGSVESITGPVSGRPKSVDPTDDEDKLDEEMRRRVQFGDVVEDAVCYKNRRGYAAADISMYEFQEIVLSGNRLEKNSNGSFNMFGPQGDCECSLKLVGFRKISAEKKCYPSATYF